MLEAAHRVPGRSKRQKLSFQTILEHLKKRIPKSVKIFLSKSIFKVDCMIFRRSTRNYLVNPYYEGPDFTCSEDDFLDIFTAPKMSSVQL